MQIENIKTSDLVPYARNARQHSDSQIASIIASIREFGFTQPILIDRLNTVIAGHGRLAAAQKMEMETVPVIRLEHLTDTQRRAYTLIDNQLALNSTWDTEMLKIEIEELDNLQFDVDLLSFPDIDDILKETITKTGEGSKELNESDFSEFDHQCPKCGFEFNAK